MKKHVENITLQQIKRKRVGKKKKKETQPIKMKQQNRYVSSFIFPLSSELFWCCFDRQEKRKQHIQLVCLFVI